MCERADCRNTFVRQQIGSIVQQLFQSMPQKQRKQLKTKIHKWREKKEKKKLSSLAASI